MASGTASFGMDGTGAFSVMGYVAGISEELNTPVYVNAVLRYAHGRLSDAFDLYLDRLAKDKPDNFMHVYEWPTGFRDYGETVGEPGHRLWAHVLNGPAANAVASFVFLPSERPVPVNPILEAEGVKPGIHIFQEKATVFEYGLPVTIAPRLARYLVYLLDGSKEGGKDKGFRNAKTGQDGDDIGISEGPVKLREAGNGKTKRKFTDAFIAFYSGDAQNLMQTQILPRVERDIMTAANKMGTLGLIGVRSQKKVINMAGWAAGTAQAYGAAKNIARAQLKAMEKTYLAESEATRRRLYGA